MAKKSVLTNWISPTTTGKYDSVKPLILPDENLLLSANGSAIKIVNLSTGNMINSLIGGHNNSKITDIKLFSSNTYSSSSAALAAEDVRIISTGSNGSVVLWNLYNFSAICGFKIDLGENSGNKLLGIEMVTREIFILVTQDFIYEVYLENFVDKTGILKENFSMFEMLKHAF